MDGRLVVGGYSVLVDVVADRVDIMNRFKEGQHVRVKADGRTGTVTDPDYVYHGVLILWDKPESPTRLMAPFLPEELEGCDA